MNQQDIISMANYIKPGQLFYQPNQDIIEGYIPTSWPSNHAPHLTQLNNGDILCVWFAGSDEGRSDVNIVMSRLSASSGCWSAPVRVSEDDMQAEQNPSLFQADDGTLWLLHTSMDTRGCTLEEWQQKLAAKEVEGPFAMQNTSVIRCRKSTDHGHTWSESFTLFDRKGSFCRQAIQQLGNGDWLFPMWYSLLDDLDDHSVFGQDYSVVRRSVDQGLSWEEEVVIPGGKGKVHMSIIELEPNRLVGLFRSRAADRIYMSRSEDNGSSWSEAKRTELPNNNASISAIRLKSGSLAVIYNDFSANDDPKVTLWPYERYPVTVALSEDEGETWPYRRVIEPGDGYSGEANRSLNRRYEYPWIMQDNEQVIHAVFAYQTRKCIKHVAFTEQWVRGEGANPWPWRNFPAD